MNLSTRSIRLAACAFLGMSAGALAAQFQDATVILKQPQNITVADKTYVGPFASIIAGFKPDRTVSIGEGSNVQDSCRVDGRRGSVTIGNGVIIAHGSSVVGAKWIETSIGLYGPGNPDDLNTPENEATDNCFVSFNAMVEGAIIEKGAIVSALARVGPYVYIESGRKVLPGKNITRQSEVAAATVPVTMADVLFMEGVLAVNGEFAEKWPGVVAQDPGAGLGINADPDTTFNPGSQVPTIAGVALTDSTFKGRRIIGAVETADNVSRLKKIMGPGSSLRADEGEPFAVGTIRRMSKNVTFHALEETHIETGNNATYGRHAIVHGGPTPFGDTAGHFTKDVTVTGENFKIGDESVFFRSRAGNDVVVGKRSVVQQCDLAAGTVIPDRKIFLNGVEFGNVEW